MKRFVITSAAIIALGTSAFAGSCPGLMTKIDEALKTAELTEADKTKVMDLRKKGEEQHNAGQHSESVATLNEALKTLRM